jgi:small redox-active disulfide protein 2
MLLQVLGPGCARCKQLAENAEQAAKELGADYYLEKVTDINRITAFGVVVTPALVVDGRVLFSGKVPSVNELKEMLN